MKGHLGIDFSSIWGDFGRQVGRENEAKIDQKRHRKNDENKKSGKMAKKSKRDAPTTQDSGGSGPRGGPPPFRSGKPLPPVKTWPGRCLGSAAALVLPCLFVSVFLGLGLAFLVLSWPVLAPSWLGLASQLGSPNPPKSAKDRFQHAFPC